jgi:hypothetical protein
MSICVFDFNKITPSKFLSNNIKVKEKFCVVLVHSNRKSAHTWIRFRGHSVHSYRSSVTLESSETQTLNIGYKSYIVRFELSTQIARYCIA